MNRTTPQYNPAALTAAAVCAMLCLAGRCRGQGTVTFTFEGQPRGTEQQIGGYAQGPFWVLPIAPGSLILNGGGMPAYPDNGTGYLGIPDGAMTFGYTNAIAFSLLSFDAAPYASDPPPTIEVIGYVAVTMGPITRVTNYFTLTSRNFETLHPDSSFANIFRVDVINASWSLDNLVITGVPEPSATALLILGSASVFVFPRLTRNGRKK